MKSPLKSKTLWINWLMATAAFAPGVSEWLSAHPEALMLGMAVVNTALRLITKDRIGLE